MPSLRSISYWAAILAQVSAAPSLVSRSSYTPSITWGDCPENITAPSLDCGQLVVPMDYDNPDNGQNVTLFMARLNANGTNRLGSIVYNPGGPGSSASTDVLAVALGEGYLYSPELLAHYDVIGVDPRGVGFSQPVTCDPQYWNNAISYRPQNDAEYDALVANNKAFGESCRNMTGPLIDFLDTVHVVKDMEQVRIALGEGKLNYLGQSYGTQIGEQYTELYPENIGRMVLDGIDDHSLSETDFVATAAVTLEITLNKFFQWCNTTQDCALYGTDVVGTWDGMIADAKKTPIPAPGCVSSGACRPNVTVEDLVFSVKLGLHAFSANPLFGAGWPALSEAIGEAAQGNATLLSIPILTSTTDGTFATIAISCQDWTRTANSSTELVLRQQMNTALAPHSDGYPAVWLLQAGCIGWPAKVTNPNHVLNLTETSKAPQILLVHSFWDPATSIEWANNVRHQIPGSVLVTRNGVGHTSYQLAGETTAAMDAWLINGTMPVAGTIYQS